MNPRARSLHGSAALIALGTSLLFAAPAQAQDGLATSTEDIIVTARKRSETSIAVPVVVTAIGAEELQRRAIISIDGLARAVPQLITGESGGSISGGMLSLRGIGGTDTNPLADTPVTFNIDGVPLSRPGVRRLSTLDVAQFEVLKGPQALFFGKNSPAGIISIRTADPTPQFEAKLSAGYEFHGREWRGEGYVAGPLAENVGFRIAAFGSHQGGWLTNIVPANEPLREPDRHGPKNREYAVRGTLLMEPTDRLTIRTKLTRGRSKTTGVLWSTQLIDCPLGTPQNGQVDECRPNDRISKATVPPSFRAIDPRFNDDTYFKASQWFASNEINYNLSDDLLLTAVSGYFNYKASWLDQGNMSYKAPTMLISQLDYKGREFSQELRLASSFDGPFNFMLGAHYQKSRTSVLTSAYANANAPVLLSNFFYLQKGEAYSGFGQASFKPIPTLEISAGGRYSYEKKRLPLVKVGGTAGNPVLTPVTPGRDHDSWNNFSPEVTVNWRPTRSFTAFASYKKGFLSGGFNASAGGQTTDQSYDPFVIKGFEGGVKALIAPGLRTNLSGYTYKINGLQVVSTPNGINAVTTNAGAVSLKGIEFDVNYRHPVGVSLFGSIGYNKARYNRFTITCYQGQTQAQGCNFGPPRFVANPAVPGTTKPIYSTQNLAGTQITRAPDWVGNVGFDAERPLSSGLKIGVGAIASYSASYFTDTPSKPAGRMPHYVLLDGSIRISEAGDRWEAALIGRNLTNKYYWARSSDQVFTGTLAGDVTSTPVDTGANLSRGREIFLRFSVKI